MAVGIWFQIWGAAEEKARRPKSVLCKATEALQKESIRWDKKSN